VSIYGGIVGVNDTLDEATALEMSKQFLEVIVAPDFTPRHLVYLKKEKPAAAKSEPFYLQWF